MTCATCGAAIEPTATSCPSCGAAVSGPNVSAASDDPGQPPQYGEPPHPAGAAGYGTPPPSGGGGYPPPQHPSGVSNEARNWAMGAHLSAFIGAWLLVAFVGPLVVWLVKREDHPFIDHHAKEAVNFNLSFLLYGVGLGILAVPIGLLTIGLGLIPLLLVGGALVIAWLVLTIVAAVNAANGEGYRYPLTIRFVR